MMKKLVSVLLAVLMVLCMGTVAFADSAVIETDAGTLSVMKISETKYLMSDGSTTATMNLEETEDSFKVSVTGGDSDGYFLADKVAGTIYSSYTGKTIKVNPVTEINEPGIQLMSTKELVSTKNYDISYKQLADLVGTTASLYSIASGIISIVGVAYGIVLVTIPTAIYSFLKGELLDKILAGIKSKAGNHGVRVTVGTYKIQRHRSGRLETGYEYGIVDIGTY